MLKLAKPPTAGDEDDQHRVYGTHPRSLAGVHALLQDRGLPTYDFLARCEPSPQIPVFWAAMSHLDGEALPTLRDAPDRPDLFRALGEALGALHQTTRAFDGTVDRTVPHGSDWADAFFASFEEGIRRHLELLAEPDLASALRALADHHRRTWVRPDRYVLSHVDGLQGHARRDGSAWRFVGHVDLEDVVFLDARFALAGFELGNGGGRAPETFWEGYRTLGPPLDPSYSRVRDLFQAYLLVNWLWIRAERPRLLQRIGLLVQRAADG